MCIKRLIYLTVAAALLGPLGTVNAATIVNLISTIDGGQANAGAGTGSIGTGSATMTLDLDTNLFSWNVSWQDLSGAATAAHFHGPAAAGVNAGVQVSISTTSPAIDSAILDAGQIADLLADLWYINIHTSLNPGGEIRGQVLVDTDGDGDPDVTDPDDDNDFIRDELDTQPLVANNNCTTNDGTNATLVGATISAEQATCASKESVDVSGTTSVGVDGDLRLISENVSLTDTSVTDNGRMEVINADPCPGCVFQCTTSPVWVQLGADIDGEAALDGFGRKVAMSSDGNTVIISSEDNDGGGMDAGHARVHRYDGASWNQLGADIDGEAAFDLSGSSVAISSDGNTVVIGAIHADYPSGFTQSGHARVYHYSEGSWNQLGADIDGEAVADSSGSSVAMSSDGQTVIVGAPGNDGAANNAGHARVYHYNGTSWNQFGADIDGEAADDRSGVSVAMSNDGNTVMIGSTQNDGAGPDAGHVRVYRFDGGWSQLGGDLDGEAAGDAFGRSVAMSSDGQTVAIGAFRNDDNGDNAGHARMYRFDGASWNQLGADIDGEAATDSFGNSIGMSSDGNTVIIGAPGNSSDKAYRFDGAGWNQLGTDISAEHPGDSSGSSVSMSGDGETVIVGAPANDGAGGNAGHARVYALGCAAAE